MACGLYSFISVQVFPESRYTKRLHKHNDQWKKFSRYTASLIGLSVAALCLRFTLLILKSFTHTCPWLSLPEVIPAWPDDAWERPTALVIRSGDLQVNVLKIVFFFFQLNNKKKADTKQQWLYTFPSFYQSFHNRVNAVFFCWLL